MTRKRAMEIARDVMDRCDFPILPGEISDAILAAIAEERAEIVAYLGEYDGTTCTHHENNPHCHTRTAAAIREKIEARGEGQVICNLCGHPREARGEGK